MQDRIELLGSPSTEVQLVYVDRPIEVERVVEKLVYIYWLFYVGLVVGAVIACLLMLLLWA